MQESHEAQYKISQLLNHLSDDQKMDPSTAYHRQAVVELKAEVNRWYNSFCQVASSQKDYVRTLSLWLRLTDGLKENGRHSLHSAAVAGLCDKWLSSLDKLPDKVLLFNLITSHPTINEFSLYPPNEKKKSVKLLIK